MQKQSRFGRLSCLEQPLSETGYLYDRIMFGGLIAFSLIIVQAFIAIGITDPASFISVTAFAISIPLLVLYLYSYGALRLVTPVMAPARVVIVYFGSVFVDVIGMDAAFWHMSWIAGLLFIIGGIVGIIVFLFHSVSVVPSGKNPLSELE
jgi:hypothetical protein